MDGNWRYAKKWNLTKSVGHKVGFLVLMSMFKFCYDLGVRYVTIYAFSIDNFKRHPEAVQSFHLHVLLMITPKFYSFHLHVLLSRFSLAVCRLLLPGGVDSETQENAELNHSRIFFVEEMFWSLLLLDEQVQRNF
ncbi:Alkyl transferase [Melia azedarach]|uniref:Alkyl transferase n=1 Tax=Melia azedarach TaxID=155640 RepID=A0ACC1YW93_MELAZ|nr:Alkyl transferase [Melia azedarach]